MITEPLNTFKTLDAVFGTNPTPIQQIVPVETSQPVVVSNTVGADFPTTNELMDDYQKARMSLRNLLEKGEHMVDNMIQIATQTESARGFEVASNMLKTMSEVAKDLVGLHEATNKAKKKSDEGKPQQVNNTQNNVVFQGSTTDLFNMIQKK